MICRDLLVNHMEDEPLVRLCLGRNRLRPYIQVGTRFTSNVMTRISYQQMSHVLGYRNYICGGMLTA